MTGYVWIDETPSEYGFLKQHNEGNQSLYFAPLTRVADAISVASKLQMELSFLSDRAVAKSSCGEYVKAFYTKAGLCQLIEMTQCASLFVFWLRNYLQVV